MVGIMGGLDGAMMMVGMGMGGGRLRGDGVVNVDTEAIREAKGKSQTNERTNKQHTHTLFYLFYLFSNFSLSLFLSLSMLSIVYHTAVEAAITGASSARDAQAHIHEQEHEHEQEEVQVHTRVKDKSTTTTTTKSTPVRRQPHPPLRSRFHRRPLPSLLSPREEFGFGLRAEFYLITLPHLRRTNHIHRAHT